MLQAARVTVSIGHSNIHCILYFTLTVTLIVECGLVPTLFYFLHVHESPDNIVELYRKVEEL